MNRNTNISGELCFFFLYFSIFWHYEKVSLRFFVLITNDHVAEFHLIVNKTFNQMVMNLNSEKTVNSCFCLELPVCKKHDLRVWINNKQTL